MMRLLDKYAAKLAAHGLCDAGEPILGGLDAEIAWNRPGPETEILGEVVRGLNINSILFARPAEPYFSIMNRLAAGRDIIGPEDCETRTFLHDIPVAFSFSAGEILPLLRKRKSAVVPGRGIVTFGTVSPEQAFVTYSSVCFSLFVKFFTDRHYAIKREGRLNGEDDRVARTSLDAYASFMEAIDYAPTHRGPFTDPGEVIAAMAEAGRMTVDSRMVDSFFGNISYRLGDTIYISQTGSSLDELEGYIDPCPMDGSSTAAVTASSELGAHRGVYGRTPYRAILHGHPRFCVIMSMICDEEGCDQRGSCHTRCNRERSAGGVPIVPGEVGTGPRGIITTLPPVMEGAGAIVWGHGLFTTGRVDFTDAFSTLAGTEAACFHEYRERTGL